MTQEFKINEEALNTLANISEELNNATTEMNEQIKAVEQALIKSSPGVSAWTDNYFTVSTNERDSYYKIGFCRVKDDWRIVCQRFDTKEGYLHGRLMPLLYTQRIVRMEAVALIDELIIKLTEKTQAFLNDVESKKSMLSTLDA